MLQIIVDAPFGKELPLVHRTPLINLVTASKQKGYAKAYAIECGVGDGPWLLVSPVCFHTTHCDVLMVSDGCFKELESYYQLFSRFIQADGWHIHQVLPHLWLMKAPNMPSLESASLMDIAHQSLKPFLDSWPSAWKTWFTEIQMLFETDVSKQINGVWVWGSGDYQVPLSFLTYTSETRLNDGDYVMMQASDAAAWLVRHHRVHWWWQDTDFIQQPPSLWKRFKQWCAYGN